MDFCALVDVGGYLPGMEIMKDDVVLIRIALFVDDFKFSDFKFEITHRTFVYLAGCSTQPDAQIISPIIFELYVIKRSPKSPASNVAFVLPNRLKINPNSSRPSTV